jgi:hypothetical protein
MTNVAALRNNSKKGYFCIKCSPMIPEKNLKISFEESSLKGKEIIARQPVTTYAQALAQVKRLKETSKVSSSLKKGGSFVFAGVKN